MARDAQPLSIDLKKTAVLSMGYQIRQLSFFPEDFQKQIIAKTNKVLEKSRQNGMYIIHIEAVFKERKPENAIHPAMAPLPGETLLTKYRVGPFTTTNLDDLLKQHQIDTLVLMGMKTSGVVLNTVRCGSDMDYKVVVISDCCGDQDEEVHRILMDRVISFTATVINSNEFFQLVDKAAGKS
jgi:nicotinamidase-related amidase